MRNEGPRIIQPLDPQKLLPPLVVIHPNTSDRRDSLTGRQPVNQPAISTVVCTNIYVNAKIGL